MNIGAFLVINLLQRNIDSENMYDWGGLAKETPLAGIFAVIFFFSLQDSTSWRMVAKFVVFRSLLSTGEIFGLSLAIVGAINAVIGLVYYSRISKIIWMDSPKEDVQKTENSIIPSPLKVVGFVSLILTIVSGIFPGIFSNLGEASSIFFNS